MKRIISWVGLVTILGLVATGVLNVDTTEKLFYILFAIILLSSTGIRK